MIWKNQSCIFGSWCISFIRNLNFSLGLSYTERWESLSCVQLFATPVTVQYMEFSRLEYWSGKPFPSPGDLLNPGIKPRSPTLQADSLPAEPQEKPRNTGVGSLSLLQQIFPTQESTWALLHCRQILYQLSYQGSLSYTERHSIEGKRRRGLDGIIDTMNMTLRKLREWRRGKPDVLQPIGLQKVWYDLVTV